MDNEGIVRRVLQTHSISRLNPVQEEAITKGLFRQTNLVISAPTGSGKTLCAEMAALHTVSAGKKVVIISPLKALATEHYETFRKVHENTALSIGDYDSQDTYLKNYDIISCSYEKFDSLLRHRSPWVPDIGLLIVDEVHEIDSDRGPTLEAVITRFLHSLPGARVIALSATIPNAFELADWLSAPLVLSDYRAVPLKEGVYHDSVIDYITEKEEVREKAPDSVLSLVKHSLSKGQQALVFANTRRNAESLAKKISLLVQADSPELAEVSEKVGNVLESPTEQCRKLAEAVRRGVAFHHAGLVQKQRKLVEEAFRRGLIRVMCSTPTVAAGVNLPAHYVIIPSVHVYRDGPSLMTVREYKQKVGRAGRIKYDTLGEAVTIARSSAEKNMIIERYVQGVPERVDSRMGDLAVLRTHVLACTCSLITSVREIKEYFSKTFYAYLAGAESLDPVIQSVLGELESDGFVKNESGRYVPTRLGMRVNELYLDPKSAKNMLDCISSEKRASDLGYLLMAADTTEMRPWLSVSRKDEIALFERAASEQGLFKTVDGFHFDYFYLNKFKLASMLRDWIEEKSEQTIMNDYNIPPGVLYSFLSNADWILYSAAELARIIDRTDRNKEISILRKRVKHGIRKELVPLVMLKHVGRVRARILWNAGARKLSDLKKIPAPELERLLGKKTAEKVIEQVK